MTDRLARQRWWISCLYGLAVVLAQGFHTHHAPSTLGDPTIASEAPTCGDEHPAGGTSLAFSSCATDCPSCEFTLSHQATPVELGESPEVVGQIHVTVSTPADPAIAPARPRSRAPPAC